MANDMRATKFTALITGAILVLGACGTGNSGGIATRPDSAATSPGTDATPGGGGNVTETGGTGACPADAAINVGMVVQGQNNVRTDNPWMPTSTGQILAYNRVRLEPMAIINRLDTSQITPWLVSDYQWNDDYTAVTLTARDGVTWSDGTPFTADDIAATLMVSRDTVVDGQHTLDPQGLIGDITVNGNQVTAEFTRPRLTDWTNVLQAVVMQKAYLDTLTDEEIMT
ncbi:MAG: ABC transporter substrate-binding protein, partial [Cellulomonadaceae bacterium]|nr:ABC transporter substrate-binding protein [Cellulomonadaceae bacterium]